MPKQKTDDLIQLIKSLTRAEKRHFRLFVRRNQASDNILFLQLFDFLDKYKDYNEQLILRKLPAIKKRQLSNLKAHLYKQLLVSLRLLNKNHTHDIQIREQIDYARLLYNKSLYRQSLDILDKAKQRAFKTKNNSIALEIVEFEKHIEGQYITRSIEGRAVELTQENNYLNKSIVETNKFSNLSLKLYAHYLRMGYVRDQKDYEDTKILFESNFPEIGYDTLDFLGKIYYCQSFVWYYLITQDFLKCYRYAQRWVNLFEEEEELKEWYAPLYLKGLHNLLNSLFHILYYDRFVVVLEELESFEEVVKEGATVNVEGLFFLFKYIHSIQKHYLEGTFTKGIKLIPDLANIIEAERYNWDERRIMVFYYRIACLYFGSGDNNNAIHYLNLIINQKNPDYRGDIQCFSRILNLIAHFDLGNAQLVEYQVKSVYRFLSKMEDLGKVQKEIFRFLRRTPKMQESEMKKEFMQLTKILKRLETAPFERRPFLYLDIISWLESKIEERPIQEIIREKFLERQKQFRKE